MMAADDVASPRPGDSAIGMQMMLANNENRIRAIVGTIRATAISQVARHMNRRCICCGAPWNMVEHD